MIGQFSGKWGIVCSPAAILDNTALTTNVIDTLGYDRCEIVVVLGATDIALTVLKVQESNVAASATALTGGADITGTVGGTDFTLPTATDDNKIGVLDINLVGNRKRYLDVSATIGDGAAGGFVTILYRLSKAKIDPDSVTLAGLLFRQVIN